MKTLISGLFIYPGKVGGAENYFYNLLKGFQNIGYNKICSLLLQEKFKNDYDRVICHYDNTFVRLKTSRILYDHLLISGKKIFREAERVFFPNYVVPLLKNRKQKIFSSILDLQYIHYPEFFSRRKRIWLRYAHELSLRYSEKVYCISDFVRKDILEKYGSRYDKKLLVTHIPIDFKRFETEEKSDKKYDFPYILSVAAQYPHKNTLTLIKAFHKFSKRNPDVRLILNGQVAGNLVGGNYNEYSNTLKNEISKNPNIIVTGYVDEQTLGLLYRNSKLFVFPSLFEGFGMPTIEAMGMGIPTIVSDNTSLREVTMDKAIYLTNPLNSDELAEKMDYAFSNISRLSKEFHSISKTIREKYSLENIASKYSDLFQISKGKSE